MLEITHYIKEVLSQNNAVVIPNFGTFEWLYIPAKLDLLEHVVIAPTHKLAFNAKNQQDKKQLLATYIAQKEGISLDEAKEALVNFRLQTDEALAQGKELQFTEFGILKNDSSANKIFIFSPEAEAIISPSYGLPNIEVMPILRDRSTKAAAATQKTKSNFRKIYIWGSAALLLLLLGTAPWWWSSLFGAAPIADNSTETEEEVSIIPDIIEAQEKLLELISAYQKIDWKEIDAPIAEDTKSDTTETKTEEKPSVSEENKETPKEENKKEPATPVTGSELGPNDYAIVIGVFGNAGNIAKNEQRLRDAGYRVQSKKLYTGYIRVAAVVNCASKAELKEKVNEVRQKFIQKAWVAKN